MPIKSSVVCEKLAKCIAQETDLGKLLPWPARLTSQAAFLTVLTKMRSGDATITWTGRRKNLEGAALTQRSDWTIGVMVKDFSQKGNKEAQALAEQVEEFLCGACFSCDGVPFYVEPGIESYPVTLREKPTIDLVAVNFSLRCCEEWSPPPEKIL